MANPLPFPLCSPVARSMLRSGKCRPAVHRSICLIRIFPKIFPKIVSLRHSCTAVTRTCVLPRRSFLGIGGVRALRAMGIEPSIYHMNEGHSAFLGIELIREYISKGYPVNLAQELVSSKSVFHNSYPCSRRKRCL